MISKLYTIISNKLRDRSLYFGDRYNRWVLANQRKSLGPRKCRDFEQIKYIEIIALICLITSTVSKLWTWLHCSLLVAQYATPVMPQRLLQKLLFFFSKLWWVPNSRGTILGTSQLFEWFIVFTYFHSLHFIFYFQLIFLLIFSAQTTYDLIHSFIIISHNSHHLHIFTISFHTDTSRSFHQFFIIIIIF